MNTFNDARGPGSRAAQKEATAREVLAAARSEFEEKGFEAASVRGIAARAGVSAGTVIHHYGEKRDLLHAALFEDLEEALDRALARLDEAADLEHQLRGLARAVFAYYERRPTLSRTLLKESLFADPPWAERFTAQVARVHGAIARLAGASVARGELRAEADPALFAVAWFSFFYFALIGWTQGALPHPVAVVERLTTEHLRGLRPEGQARTRPSAKGAAPAPAKRARTTGAGSAPRTRRPR